MSGGDEALGKELQRYKSQTDVAKELVRQKAELSKRREAPSLAKDATPEQIGDYRKAMGVPEAPEGYAIKAPDGYSQSDGEKALLADYAKEMHAKNVPAAVVKENMDFFFKSQAAQQQALNKSDMTKQAEWTKEMQTEFGGDYKPFVESAKAYLGQQFEGNSEGLNALVNARLPGGGRVGDHPGFIKMAVDAALKAGFTDRIEAADIESNGGKSLEAQQMEIENLQFKNRDLYNASQGKLDKIIKARLSKGEIDERGNPIRRRA